MFTQKDISQIEEKGLSVDKVKAQIENFKRGFPFLPVSRAATVGDGIFRLSGEEVKRMVEIAEKESGELAFIKFVPASGAASRMFKDLYGYVSGKEESASVGEVLNRIEEFAFYPELRKYIEKDEESRQIVKCIIGEPGLNYGKKPKALLSFHRYKEECRTALEEHLVEGAAYAKGKGDRVSIHFTVSPEHREDFKKLTERVVPEYEKRYGVTYEISYSEQQSATDTIAVDEHNEPFRSADGTLLFRPAGHGALIGNLNALEADVIYIKTVDNVTVECRIKDTVCYKKVLLGVLLSVQDKIFAYLKEWDKKVSSSDFIDEVAHFVENNLSYKLPLSFGKYSLKERGDYLYKILDRPIRVCGMVKNEGEPGGGPFWVTASDGAESLQIAESSQIAPDKKYLMKEATHFNPVDLLCGVNNFRGEKFDLTGYTDPSTGFISQKSQDGKPLKAQELPGLWNGAMANWTTLFVEVPITTFNPVKTINDLLRPAHQAIL